MQCDRLTVTKFTGDVTDMQMQKAEFALCRVFYDTAYFVLFIEIDLKALKLTREHASFIDLDIDLPLCVEVGINASKFATLGEHSLPSLDLFAMRERGLI